jgi:hypothetical protein
LLREIATFQLGEWLHNLKSIILACLLPDFPPLPCEKNFFLQPFRVALPPFGEKRLPGSEASEAQRKTRKSIAEGE